MKDSFEREVNEFISKIKSMKNTLPLIMNVMTLNLKEFYNKLDEFIKDNAISIDDSNKKHSFGFPLDKIQEINQLTTSVKHLEGAFTTIPRSFIVSLVSLYDAYLGNIIKVIYCKKPEKLNRSEKSFNYTEIMEFGSLDDFRNYIIEKEIESVLRKSHVKHFEWLENLLGIPLRKGLDVWPIFVEVTERRNLFVHCDGIISNQYLKICDEHKVKFDNGEGLGLELNVSPAYYSRAYSCIFEIGVKLAHVIWRKLEPHKIETADINLINVIHDLLLEEDYELAKALAEFATNLPRHSNQEKKLMFIVNKALAYKWSGEYKKCKKIIEEIDWSAYSDKFQLAYAVILDDYETAGIIMRRIGKNHDIITKMNYNHWSLFKEFRSTKIFLDIYEELFHESYDVWESESEEIVQKEIATSLEE